MATLYAPSCILRSLDKVLASIFVSTAQDWMQRRNLWRGALHSYIWALVVEVGLEIENACIPFVNSWRWKVGDGKKVKFWTDTWVGDRPLCEEFPRLFAAETQRDASGRLGAEEGNGGGCNR